MFESRCYSRLLQHSTVAFFGFGRRDVADGLQEPPIIEPVEGSVHMVLYKCRNQVPSAIKRPTSCEIRGSSACLLADAPTSVNAFLVGEDPTPFCG